MPHTFTSFRLTAGNAVFPITVMIDNHNVYWSKGFLIGRSRIAIPKQSIASVGLINKVIFSDIVIETQGGQTFYLNGFTHPDAREIYRLLTATRLN